MPPFLLIGVIWRHMMHHQVEVWTQEPTYIICLFPFCATCYIYNTIWCTTFKFGFTPCFAAKHHARQSPLLARHIKVTSVLRQLIQSKLQGLAIHATHTYPGSCIVLFWTYEFFIQTLQLLSYHGCGSQNGPMAKEAGATDVISSH